MYSRQEWEREDKMLVVRLIQKKRYKEAEKFVSDLSLVAETDFFQQYLFGLAFALSMVAVSSKGGD